MRWSANRDKESWVSTKYVIVSEFEVSVFIV